MHEHENEQSAPVYQPPRVPTGILLRAVRQFSPAGRLTAALARASANPSTAAYLEDLEIRTLRVLSRTRPLRPSLESQAQDSLLYCVFRRLQESRVAEARKLLSDPILDALPDARAMRQIVALVSGHTVRDPCLTPAIESVNSAMRQLASAGSQSTEECESVLVRLVSSGRSDPWCNTVPSFGRVVATLASILKAILQPGTPEPEERPLPAWLEWMLLRFRLLGNEPAERVVAAHVGQTSPEFRWLLSNWSSLYGPRRDDVSADNSSSPAHSKDWQTGDLVGSLVRDERILEEELREARWNLRKAAYSKAARELRRILQGLAGRSKLTELWWTPAVLYWLGVAEASNHRDEEAIVAFQRIVPSVMGDDARGQLALLSIRSGDLDAADLWIQGATRVTPGVHYATGLLWARRGEWKRAKQYLNAYGERFPTTDSAYGPACQRLLAVLDERAGDRPAAMRGYVDLLRNSPGDGVTRARYLRCRVASAYDAISGGREPHPASTQVPNQRADSEPEWSRAYTRLERLIFCGPDDLAKQAAEPAIIGGGLSSPWLAVYLNRLAASGQSGLIPQTLRRVPGIRVSEHSAHVFLLWDALRSAWRGGAPNLREPSMQQADLLKHLKAEREILLALQVTTGADDLEAWIRMAKAVETKLAAADGGLALADSEPFDTMESLLQASSDANAFALIRKMFQSLGMDDSRLDSNQRRLWHALRQLNDREWETFIASYAAFQSELCTLPLSAADLWVAWAQGNLLAEGPQAVLETDVPHCLADLSHPGVSLLTGIAYAHLAIARHSAGDAGQALRLARQARSAIEPTT